MKKAGGKSLAGDELLKRAARQEVTGGGAEKNLVAMKLTARTANRHRWESRIDSGERDNPR